MKRDTTFVMVSFIILNYGRIISFWISSKIASLGVRMFKELDFVQRLG